MVRRLAAISIVIAALAGASSAAFGCGDELPAGAEGNGDGDGGVGSDVTTTTDAPVNDVTPGDAGNDADAATSDGAACNLADPQGLFYRAPLDVNCDGWAVTQGVVTKVTDQARCGAGSCRVCMTGTGEAVLNRDLLVDKAIGTFELDYEIRGDTFTGGLNSNMYLFDDAGAQVGFGQNATAVTAGNWQSVQVVSANATGTTAKVMMRMVAIVDAGATYCYYVDEFRVGHY